MWRYAFWGSWGGLALLAAGVGLWARPLYSLGSELAPGVSVGGLRGAAPPGVESELRRLAQGLEAQSVELELPGDGLAGEGMGPPVRATLAELGVSVDLEATLRRARSLGRRGSPLARQRELRSLHSEGLDVPLALSFDVHELFERLEPLKAAIDRRPLPPRYDARAGALIPHVPGRYLDLERTADSVWALANARAAQLTVSPPAPARVELALTRIAPRVNSHVLGPFEPRAVASEFSTRFRTRGNQATRAQNIAVAAARLDGLILMPGERLSFNDVVGERSLQNGFQESWELLNGELTRGVGGGTCQVSSTLHAAALHAGLDIVQAYPHSRPLAYIGKGLDATVAWPFIDLELKNPWPVPLVITSSVRAGTLTVRVLAQAPPARVRVRSEVKQTLPFPRVVEVSGRAPRGGYKQKQEGIPGYTIQRTRQIWPKAGPETGELRRELHVSRYRPTPEVYLVAPDLDLADLPPLPEGAEGYEPEEEAEEEEETEMWGEAPGPLG